MVPFSADIVIQNRHASESMDVDGLDTNYKQLFENRVAFSLKFARKLITYGVCINCIMCSLCFMHYAEEVAEYVLAGGV